MRKCPNCGAEVDDAAAFCINCGASMAGVPVEGAAGASPMDQPFGMPAAPAAPAAPTVDQAFGQPFGQSTAQSDPGFGQPFGQSTAQPGAGFAQSGADSNYQQNYQQTAYSQPQGGPAPAYVAPASQPVPPAYYNTENEVVSVGDWVVSMLLMCIPIVNLILLCVWAFGSDAPMSKKNWAKAQLIWLLIGIILIIILVIIFGAAVAALVAAVS